MSHPHIIKAKEIVYPLDIPCAFVTKKEILKQTCVFNLRDRMISINEDYTLVHLKRNAKPKMFHALNAVLDPYSEKIELPLEELFTFCLVANIPLVELLDRFITLIEPCFWSKKPRKKK